MTKPKPSIDFGYPTKANGRIPSFQNIEEEAEFWDTHDLAEFMGVELQPTEIIVGPELTDRLTVRLDRAERDELDKRAKSLGVGPSALARIWIKERLKQDPKAKAS